jgi:hypothetical protein
MTILSRLCRPDESLLRRIAIQWASKIPFRVFVARRHGISSAILRKQSPIALRTLIVETLYCPVNSLPNRARQITPHQETTRLALTKTEKGNKKSDTSEPKFACKVVVDL